MYYVFHASLFAKIRKRFIADIPACIDIDFSLFVNIHDYEISLTA